MDTREIGTTGQKIPEIGLGTWSYQGGPEVLRAGLDAGALFIDTAESYGSEPVVGEAIAGRRGQVFLATKVSPENFRPADLRRSLEASLQRLRTDRVDLYQLHSPNEAIPLEETLGALEEAVDQGKVRYIGVSNFSVAQMDRARRALRRHPLVANQVRFNLIDRTIEPELLPYCQKHRITVVAYSPLSRQLSHLLDADVSGVLREMARSLGRSPAQLALNWCLAHPGVVVIPKASSLEHVRDNCAASGWRLTPEQFAQLSGKVAARRRSGLESFLRRRLPPFCIRALQRLARVGPSALRRRLH